MQKQNISKKSQIITMVTSIFFPIMDSHFWLTFCFCMRRLTVVKSLAASCYNLRFLTYILFLHTCVSCTCSCWYMKIYSLFLRSLDLKYFSRSCYICRYLAHNSINKL
jgi:hypothetical protein